MKVDFKDLLFSKKTIVIFIILTIVLFSIAIFDMAPKENALNFFGSWGAPLSIYEFQPNDSCGGLDFQVLVGECREIQGYSFVNIIINLVSYYLIAIVLSGIIYFVKKKQN